MWSVHAVFPLAMIDATSAPDDHDAIELLHEGRRRYETGLAASTPVRNWTRIARTPLGNWTRMPRTGNGNRPVAE